MCMSNELWKQLSRGIDSEWTIAEVERHRHGGYLINGSAARLKKRNILCFQLFLKMHEIIAL